VSTHWQVGWGVPGGLVLVVLLGIGLFTVAVLGSRVRGVTGGKKALLIALRWLSAFAAFVLATQPAFWAERVRTEPGAVAVVLDVSRSMGVSTGEATRFARAKSLVEKWLKGSRGAEARLHTLGDVLEPAEPSELEALAPRAAATALLPRLRELSEQSDLGAVLVVSDGKDTTGAVLPKALGTRVHTVLVDDTRALRDDAIASIQPDPVAFLRGEAKVHATIESTGLGARTLTVLLKRAGRVIVTREITVPEGGRAPLELGFSPTDVGREAYTLEVAVDKDDDVPENNSRAFLVRVTRDRLRVLHVSGRPSWDQRFLRAFLKRDPSVDLVSFFILRSVHDLTMSTPSELALIPFPTDELFRQHLTSFDVVLLQDFDYAPYQMGPYLSLIRDYVAQGGGLAMIGGSLAFDGGGYAETPIAEVLPVRMRPTDPAGASIIEGPFSPEPVTALLHHPLIELYPEPAQTAAAFRRLEPLVGANGLLGIREGGAVLLSHPSARVDGGAKLPILTVGRFGRGRTLALATDTSWHWSMPTAGRGGDPSAYDRFWDRAVRWLTRDPLLDPSSLLTHRETYTPGTRIEVSGVARDESYRALGKAKLVVRLLDAKQQRVGDAAVDTDEQGSFRGVLTAPDVPGVLHAVLMHENKELTRTPFVVELSGEELANPKANGELLKRLAEQTGGRFIERPEDAPALDEFDASRSQSLGVERYAPFGNALWAALTFLLIAVEWILRRRWGEH
jgi:uncharacterized membrane protein